MKIMITGWLLAAALLGALPAGAESVTNLFPEALINLKGEETPSAKLAGKIVGIYFSAAWCPPCRAFTPTLIEFRNRNKEVFEVVFVSSDHTPAAQQQYMREYKMDVLAVPRQSPATQRLQRHYSVRGIPKLVIIDPRGKTITEDGRGELMRDAGRALQAWKEAAGL